MAWGPCLNGSRATDKNRLNIEDFHTMTQQSNDPAQATSENWWRAELLSDQADLCADALWSLGAGGVEIRDQDTFFEGSPDFAPVPDGKTRLIAFFECATPKSAHTLQRSLEELDHATVVSCAHFEDRTWETKWHEFFKPRLLAPHTMVGPPWEEMSAPDGGRIIVIQPGMAFGTGTHETTQLVSTALETLLCDPNFTTPSAMLDVGCGSGILSILAAQLGVRSVLGLEISQDPLDNACENVELNHLEEHDITFSTTPVGEIEHTYPLVVANIIAPILIAISEALIARTAPGGTLILSGILAEQMPQIRAVFGDHLDEVEETSLEPWHAIRYTKRA